MQRFTDFVELANGNLLIKLNAEGRAELAELVEDYGIAALGFDGAFIELVEYQTCNGWEWIAPEEIGALTNALILSCDTVRDDHGVLISCGRVYANMDYAIKSPAEELARNGEIILQGCGEVAPVVKCKREDRVVPILGSIYCGCPKCDPPDED